MKKHLNMRARITRTFLILIVLCSVALFIFFRWHIIDLIWKEGKLVPPEPDDSFGYISKNRVLTDSGAYLSDSNYIWSWFRNDHLAFLPWSTSLGFVTLIGNFSYLDVYQANFYFGIVALAFVILYLVKVLEPDKSFWTIALLFMTLYNGSGEYHGFFWVVPSFYSLIATFLLISIIFDTQRERSVSENGWLGILTLITFLLIWSHPLGKFSYLAILTSLVIYSVLNKILRPMQLKRVIFRRMIVFFIIGVIAILSLEVLPYIMGMSQYTYPRIENLSQANSSLSSLFGQLYFDNFVFNGYESALLAIGLCALLLTKKTSILSIYLGFFAISFASSILHDHGYRMLVYLWPLTFIVYSYGYYYLIREVFTSFKKPQKKTRKEKQKGKHWKRLPNKICVISLFALLLVSANYIYPFAQENYNLNIQFADQFNKSREDLELDVSIVDFLNSSTNQGDLIIFGDSNAFFTVTSLAILDRESAYANWNWTGDYRFLQGKINGTYLVATISPFRERIMNHPLEDDLVGLLEAFPGRLAVTLVKNFGILGVYEVIVRENETPFVVGYEPVNAMLLGDDFQETFWSHTMNINLSNDDTVKISGENSLKITLSQTEKGQNDFIWHEFDYVKNWSDKKLLVFNWYEAEQAGRVEILVSAPDLSNRFHYVYEDTYAGWKLVFVPLDSFNVVNGEPSWSNVKAIYFRFTLDSPYTQTFNLDRLFVDVRSEPEKVELVNEGAYAIGAVMPYFFIFLLPVGLMWTIFVFRVRDLWALISVPFGLSFALIFLVMFSLNLGFRVILSEISAMWVIVILSVFPPVAYFLMRMLTYKYKSKRESDSYWDSIKRRFKHLGKNSEKCVYA